MSKPLEPLEVNVIKNKGFGFMYPFVLVLTALTNLPIIGDGITAILRSFSSSSVKVGKAFGSVGQGWADNVNAVGSVLKATSVIFQLVFAFLVGVMFFKLLKLLKLK